MQRLTRPKWWMIFGALIPAATLAFATPALADRDGDRGRHHREWRHHDRDHDRGRHWRRDHDRHEWRRDRGWRHGHKWRHGHDRRVVIVRPPPRVIYREPPRAYYVEPPRYRYYEPRHGVTGSVTFRF